MLTLQWRRLDAPGGGYRAHHGLRWRATVTKGIWYWHWEVERTDHEGRWRILAESDPMWRLPTRLADAQAHAARALERLQGQGAA